MFTATQTLCIASPVKRHKENWIRLPDVVCGQEKMEIKEWNKAI